MLRLHCQSSALPLPTGYHPTPNGYSVPSLAAYLPLCLLFNCQLANFLYRGNLSSTLPTSIANFCCSSIDFCSSIAKWLLFHCPISTLPFPTGYFLPSHCYISASPLWYSNASFRLFHCQVANCCSSFERCRGNNGSTSFKPFFLGTFKIGVPVGHM